MLSHLLLLLVAFTLLIDAAFYKGADMSSLPTLDCNGSCSKFKNNASAPAQDALQILKDNGLNTVRLRIWNNPGSDGSYCNLDGVLRMAKRVHSVGLMIHLDFHYSDSWADPGKQNKPAAWASLSFNDLVKAVHDYSSQVVSALYKQGTPPAVVQVGNEIDGGMLWPRSGQACADSGSLNCGGNNWPNLGKLIQAGVEGVKNGSGSGTPPQIMLHIARMNGGGPADVVSWFKNAQSNGVSFDLIGLSCYEEWKCGGPKAIPSLSQVRQAFPGKGIVIAETAYPYYSVTSWKGDFPDTPTGQSDYLVALTKAVEALNGGSGVYWWGTELYTSRSNDVFSVFDTSAVGLPALHNGWKP